MYINIQIYSEYVLEIIKKLSFEWSSNLNQIWGIWHNISV